MLTFILTTLATASPSGALDDLAWMEGTWTQISGDLTTTEEWIRPHPDLLIGVATTIKAGKEVFFEHIQIGLVEGVVTYSVWPKGQSRPAHFRLSSKSRNRVVFENLKHDFPKKITYFKTPGKLHAKAEGKDRVEEWTFEPKKTTLPDRQLTRTATVPAPLTEVWTAWTTIGGVKSFFAPAGKIDLTTGGAYEMWFAPDQPAGMRGADDCRVIELIPEKKLVITWNFPPSLPRIRNAHTLIALKFTKKSPKETEVHMTQSGWRQGKDWDQGFAYFEAAWTKVMDRLKQRFVSGPIDWSKI